MKAYACHDAPSPITCAFDSTATDATDVRHNIMHAYTNIPLHAKNALLRKSLP